MSYMPMIPPGSDGEPRLDLMPSRKREAFRPGEYLKGRLDVPYHR